MSEPTNSETRAAGWYPDRDDGGLLRYWTGSRWTEDRTPAIAPPTAAPVATPTQTPPAVAFVQVAKSTTVGVLLWLFLGTVGAHRHYVRRHVSAVLQPVLLAAGLVMMRVGLTTQNPGGVGPNMTLFSVGAVVAAPIALWLLIDVFFIAGWVRQINDEESRPRV